MMTTSWATFAAQNTHSVTNPVILVLGDSLSAAYGFEQSKGWVNLLDDHLQINPGHDTKNEAKDNDDLKIHYQVVNASISGETTGGALPRLPPLLERYQPNIVIIELGGNDALRGFPIQKLRSNLEQLIQLSQQANAKVLLVGMQIPPNYGARYTKAFYASYGQLAQQYKTEHIPFLLADVALNPELMQTDGIHPTAQAQEKILQNVLEYLKPML